MSRGPRRGRATPSVLPALVDRWRRALWLGLSLAGVIMAVGLYWIGGGPGFDLYAYWAVDPLDPYGATQGFGAFHYSPVIALATLPLKLLPWPAVYWAWVVVLLGVLAWFGGRWWVALLAFPPVVLELYHGNIHLLLAAAALIGVRHPAAWSFLLLTKISPGVVLVWYAVRREWRHLAICLAVTAAVVAASLVVAPAAWRDWIGHLQVAETVRTPNQVPVPLLVRLPIAAAVVALGARAGRIEVLPIAAMLALPVLWFHGFAMLAAYVRVARTGVREPAGPAIGGFGPLRRMPLGSDPG